MLLLLLLKSAVYRLCTTIHLKYRMWVTGILAAHHLLPVLELLCKAQHTINSIIGRRYYMYIRVYNALL